MKEFFETTEFGQELKQVACKTSKQYKGQSIYKVEKNLKSYRIRESEHFYLDTYIMTT